jgi:hypothetical protein
MCSVKYGIMSWLVISPPIKMKANGGNASMGKDLYMDYFGVPELDVSKEPANYPRAGQNQSLILR